MWSHYGREHRGICLCFRNKGSIGEAHKVKYSSSYPMVDVHAHGALADALLTKSSEWENEQEYRIITPEGRGLMELEPEVLESVIFGCRIADEDETYDRALCEQRRTPVRLYRSVQSKSEVRVSIVPA